MAADPWRGLRPWSAQAGFFDEKRGETAWAVLHSSGRQLPPKVFSRALSRRDAVEVSDWLNDLSVTEYPYSIDDLSPIPSCVNGSAFLRYIMGPARRAAAQYQLCYFGDALYAAIFFKSEIRDDP